MMSLEESQLRWSRSVLRRVSILRSYLLFGGGVDMSPLW